MQNRMRDNLIIFSVALALYLAVGAYLTLSVRYLPYDGLSRMVSAWLVVYGTEFKLASIGFVWPPIPTLVLLPFVVIPALYKSWMAIVIVSAFFTAISCVLVNRIAELCEMPRVWRWLVTLLFGLNPMIFIFAINGMSEAILIGLTLMGLYWLIKFWQTERSTHLILAAGFLGLLPLVRYEFVIITAAAGIILVMLCWRKRANFNEKDFREFLEGRLLAYSSLAIYPLFIWSVSNWLVMGNPLYYLFNERSALSLAELSITAVGLITSPWVAFRLTFGVWIATFLVGFLASLVGVYVGWIRRSGFMILIALTPLLIPLMQFILLVYRAGVPLVRYFIMAVPLGMVVALVLINHLLPQAALRRWGKPALFGGFSLLILVSNVAALWLLTTFPYPSIEQQTWDSLTRRAKPWDTNMDESLAVGRVLNEAIPSDAKVLIDTYHYGFGVMLGVGRHEPFVDFTDPNYEEALAYPPAYVDYLILPRNEERGALYSINMEHKYLYTDGAPWAELVDILPPTVNGWKLYKVIR